MRGLEPAWDARASVEGGAERVDLELVLLQLLLLLLQVRLLVLLLPLAASCEGCSTCSNLCSNAAVAPEAAAARRMYW